MKKIINSRKKQLFFRSLAVAFIFILFPAPPLFPHCFCDFTLLYQSFSRFCASSFFFSASCFVSRYLRPLCSHFPSFQSHRDRKFISRSKKEDFFYSRPGTISYGLQSFLDLQHG